jgi:hypothetical protein
MCAAGISDAERALCAVRASARVLPHLHGVAISGEVAGLVDIHQIGLLPRHGLLLLLLLLVGLLEGLLLHVRLPVLLLLELQLALVQLLLVVLLLWWWV